MSIHLLRTCRPAFHSVVHPMRCNAFRMTECQRFASHKHRRLSNRPAVTWQTVIIGLGGTGALVYYTNRMRAEKARRDTFQKNVRVGKGLIGGPFELVDSDLKLRTNEDFKGQWLLIYFGFTHCPDICPDEIEKMVKTVEYIENSEHVTNIQPIFISVDPARDTPELVGKYIKEYSPKFIGLSGSKEQVEQVCRAFRVYYSEGPKDVDKDYIVDHTVVIYLINPDGEFVDYYTQSREVEDVATDIELQMLQYEKSKKSGKTLMSLGGGIKKPPISQSS